MPAARWRIVHAMNRSNPSIVLGGGEMNRATSSVVSIEKSEAASEIRSSRRTTRFPLNTGRPVRQSVLITTEVCGWMFTICVSISGRYGIFSIRGLLPGSD